MTSNITQPEVKHRSYFAERFHSPVIAWVILGVSLLLTLTAYFVSRHLVEQRLHDQFEFRASEINRAVEDRLHIYEQTLWSGVALFYSSTATHVERQQWAGFVEALSLDAHWPGIQGMGYSVPVRPENKNAHIDSIRAEGFREYSIKPEGERDEYSAIIYLEPFDWRNKRAFGYDMWSNAMRRAAMTRARDEGVAATSGIITLVQETSDNVQRGFLTYVPVYSGGQIPDTRIERRLQFKGWVYAAFRAENLMQGILGSLDTDIVFDVYDGEKMDSESVLYSSSKNDRNKTETPLFSKTQALTLQGRPWTIVFSTPETFTFNKESNIPTFVALTGLVIDILLFYVILSLHYINRRAKEIAEVMTQELRAAQTGLEAEVQARTLELSSARDRLDGKVQRRADELHAKIRELEKMNELTTGRELRVIELKSEVNALAVDLGRSPPYDMDEDISGQEPK